MSLLTGLTLPPHIIERLRKDEKRIKRDLQILFEGVSLPKAPALKRVLNIVETVSANYVSLERQAEYENQLREKLEPHYTLNYKWTDRRGRERSESKPIRPYLDDILDHVAEVTRNYLDSSAQMEYEQKLRETLTRRK
jgi:hypothetical protein